jgi:cytochrome P450
MRPRASCFRCGAPFIKSIGLEGMRMASEIDLLDLRSHAAEGQPHDQFRWLRRNDPVHRHFESSGPGFWAVTKYADVERVSRDPATFSSALGGVLVADAGPLELDGARNMMLLMDPPRHVRYRKLVKGPFTPTAAERLRPRIGELASQIVDAVIERGECELVSEVAGELPSYVIAALLGIPLEDGRRLYVLTEKMHSDPSVVPPQEQWAAREEMLAYARGIASEKRKRKRDDLASALVDAEVDGERLSPEEFDYFFLLLVNAGGDTTRNLVAGGLEVLFRYPHERRRLENDLDRLLPTAVEELLRYVSPVVYMRRTATRDTELGGKRIRAGDKVAMFYGSANRDEDVFTEPDRFDVGRTPNEHVAFGAGGPHYCLGAYVARVEIAAMLREMLCRMKDLEPAGPIERLPSNFIAGPKRMPVRFRPGPRRRGSDAASYATTNGVSAMDRDLDVKPFRAFGRSYRSERAAIVSFLDKVRVGEQNGGQAFAAWAAVCQTDRLRTGLRIIAEREAYHSRVFERRLEELGGEKRATVTESGRRFRERLADPNLSDAEKLRCFTEEVGRPQDAVRPIRDFAALLAEDLDTKEALGLFAEDEMSTTKWIWDACVALIPHP